jgi:hypothetical protein
MIIFKNVGVAVSAVILACFTISRIVFASFGSGVYATCTQVMSGIIVLTVNQKL